MMGAHYTQGLGLSLLTALAISGSNLPRREWGSHTRQLYPITTGVVSLSGTLML